MEIVTHRNAPRGGCGAQDEILDCSCSVCTVRRLLRKSRDPLAEICTPADWDPSGRGEIRVVISRYAQSAFIYDGVKSTNEIARTTVASGILYGTTAITKL